LIISIDDVATGLPVNAISAAWRWLGTAAGATRSGRGRGAEDLAVVRWFETYYLLIDRFTRPVSITLMSEPGEKGYRKAEAVQAGPGGSQLGIPEHFGITIDASTMPESRSAKTKPED
jgi:hypothetical protein